MDEVFISYAWGGESEVIANALEKTFQEKGIKLVRDKTDLEYKGLIKQFMQHIGQGKCIVAIVSDKYLKSKNCMYELLEISRNGKFYDRIFPIVLSDARIYDILERLNYIKYWEAKAKELEEGMKSVSSANLQGFREEIDLYTEIRNKIAGLVDTLQNMNTLTTQMHQDTSFKEMVEAIEKRLTDEKEDKSLEENIANLDMKDNNIAVNKLEEGLLIGERSIDYQELKNLLSVQKWEEADRKTWSLMFQLIGHPEQESLSEAEIKNLPCQDLKLIDGLWQEYSRGKFGFSKQKEIWISSGGQSNLKTVERLGDRVGWRQENEWLKYPFINFSLNAPEGHLPLWRFGRRNYQLAYALMRRLADCRINCQEIKNEEYQQGYPTSFNVKTLKIWQEKLGYLQEQEAITSNPSIKFELQKQIEECSQKIKELGG